MSATTTETAFPLSHPDSLESEAVHILLGGGRREVRRYAGQWVSGALRPAGQRNVSRGDMITTGADAPALTQDVRATGY